jgi:tetratricopeptide (TPR) repeat protein
LNQIPLKSKPRKAYLQFLSFLIFSLFIILSYHNTLDASWHLDDRPNIVNNHYLHIDSLQPKKLYQSFFTNPKNPEELNNKPYRPVACLTFALNWYFGQDAVFGYHLINIIIHTLSAFFLFVFILNLFATPNLKNNHATNPFFIALLASLLWAVNPIQTQAVTYIVQRMAQLAAMFYLLGMFAYLKARLSGMMKQSIPWFAACLVFFILGIFSKPNAAMLPAALLLLEVTFFQDITDKKTRKRIYFITIALGCGIILIGSVLFLKGNPLSVLNYDSRPFTLTERVLAQPRIVLFYISQIFYPMPERLSIAHDVTLSSTLLKPWTTIPAILIILALIGLSLWQLKKRPVISFAVLFFFLNHVIESSIIPLEIIFEHRNYLPSLFLFFPVAYFLSHLLLSYKKNNLIHGLIILLIVSLMIFFSASTYIRNQAWKNDITLWQDAVKKAPNNARASNILAIRLAWGDHSTHPRRFDMALKLFKDSLEKQIPRKDVKAEIYGNMALIYFHRKNEPDKAFELFDMALEINPGNLKIRRDLASAHIIQKEFDNALEQVNILLSKKENNGIYHNLKGNILLWQNKPKEALPHFKKAYNLLTNKNSVVLNSSIALSRAGYYERADGLLNEAIKRNPDNMTFYFAIIENSIRADKAYKAEEYRKRLFLRFDKEQIRHGLENYTDNPRYAPISKELITPVILDKARN